jgi:hypothetical protein
MNTNVVYSQMTEHADFFSLEMRVCVLLRCCVTLLGS